MATRNGFALLREENVGQWENELAACVNGSLQYRDTSCFNGSSFNGSIATIGRNSDEEKFRQTNHGRLLQLTIGIPQGVSSIDDVDVMATTIGIPHEVSSIDDMD